MANKINIGSGVTGKIKLNGGVIFFGVPEEGDKFIITCTSAALNTHNPEPDSLRLCLEDDYYEVDAQELYDFTAELYDTPAKVAKFLYDQFNTPTFREKYTIQRGTNRVTIKKKAATHFIGECKLVIQNSIASSSITFTQDILPHQHTDPARYVILKLLIDGVVLSKDYTSMDIWMAPPGSDGKIKATAIANNFKTLFDAHPTLSNNYIMVRDEATLIITNKSLIANRPIINLEKEYQNCSITYKYTGTLSALNDASVTFKPYSNAPSFKFTVVFTPPHSAPLGWQYNKIYNTLINHSSWQYLMNHLDFIVGTVPGATLSFTLYNEEEGGLFYEDGDVDTPKHNWSFDNLVLYKPRIDYTGYTINNDFISYAGPEFTYEEQLIRGWVG